MVGGPPPAPGGIQVLGTGLRRAASAVDVAVLMQLEFSSSSDAANIPVVPQRRIHTVQAVQKIVENPQAQFLERLLARALCATTGADCPGSADELPQLQFIDVESTLRDKFQQSSACGRCLRPVHRQSRGLV